MQPIEVRDIPSDIGLALERRSNEAGTTKAQREILAQAAEIMREGVSARRIAARAESARRAELRAVPDDARRPLKSTSPRRPLMAVVEGTEQKSSPEELACDRVLHEGIIAALETQGLSLRFRTMLRLAARDLAGGDSARTLRPV